MKKPIRTVIATILGTTLLCNFVFADQWKSVVIENDLSHPVKMSDFGGLRTTYLLARNWNVFDEPQQYLNRGTEITIPPNASSIEMARNASAMDIDNFKIIDYQGNDITAKVRTSGYQYFVFRVQVDVGEDRFANLIIDTNPIFHNNLTKYFYGYTAEGSGPDYNHYYYAGPAYDKDGKYLGVDAYYRFDQDKRIYSSPQDQEYADSLNTISLVVDICAKAASVNAYIACLKD